MRLQSYLFAITETWLTADDVAVRVELCPDGGRASISEFTGH